MDQDYDCIVLGTGLKECLLSGLLSVAGKKVLHMDRNSFYGGESASLNLGQMFQKFYKDEINDAQGEIDGDKLKEIEAKVGRSKDYNIDLCPKFIMACGDLVKILITTKVTRYLDFRSVPGSYVFKQGKGLHKVPVTPGEAMKSSLMGPFQKRRFRNFAIFAQDFDRNDKKTWDGKELTTMTPADVFKAYKLDDNSIDFIGHAVALYPDDKYLNDATKTFEMCERVSQYAYSVSRYGGSPYIYPKWGLGMLPEGFSRLSAVHGGTYMLNRDVDEILYNEDGTVRGVKSKGEEARCKQLICDPSYILGPKVKQVGKVARWIFIMNHPLANTNNADSCQVILPANQLPQKRNDVYISVVSFAHQVAAKGKWVALISTLVETEDPKRELNEARALLGAVERDFFSLSDYHEPTDDGVKDQLFVTRSYDATTHFTTATAEVMALFERITGAPYNIDGVGADKDDLERAKFE